ncbi:hypothetical protein BV25DRAFT_1040849 [Artomyces pyxidatus]|uniref:Uncharacterized protein n=1 Tax=Artomyces pyxidatus TaxID=48021 RepID=A0ACB8SU67_9AGAM|nr:hypothetical protein BV25DRAFT_1040849 [Artomyces pyxidatus]
MTCPRRVAWPLFVPHTKAKHGLAIRACRRPVFTPTLPSIMDHPIRPRHPATTDSSSRPFAQSRHTTRIPICRDRNQVVTAELISERDHAFMDMFIDSHLIYQRRTGSAPDHGERCWPYNSTVRALFRCPGVKLFADMVGFSFSVFVPGRCSSEVVFSNHQLATLIRVIVPVNRGSSNIFQCIQRAYRPGSAVIPTRQWQYVIPTGRRFSPSVSIYEHTPHICTE